MLGHKLPQGSEAISFHSTLFRVSELCWIKAVRLTVPEIIIRVLAAVLGLAWIFIIKGAKGTYVNVEFLLAVFPLILAWNTSGSLKIGCSGDFEEAYEGRRGMQSRLFRGWIETLRKKEPDWLHLKSGSYDLLLNPNRVAWVKPCFQWRLFPLVVALVFFAYLKILELGLDFEAYPVLDEFQVLIFEGGSGTIEMLAWGIILTALGAFGLSIKRSLEICGTGGVQDVFPLSAADQSSVLAILSGNGARQKAPAKVSQKAKPVEVAVPKSEAKVESSVPPAPQISVPSSDDD